MRSTPTCSQPRLLPVQRDTAPIGVKCDGSTMVNEGLELRSPSDSLRTARERAIEVLTSVGLGQLSDTFLLPVGSTRGQANPHYARRAIVRWRSHSEPFYVRSTDVPFDLLPFRIGSGARSGGFFTVGPGLTDAATVHPAVLNVQLEGPIADVEDRSDVVAKAVGRVAKSVARSELTLDEIEWTRLCFSGVVPIPACN